MFEQDKNLTFELARRKEHTGTCVFKFILFWVQELDLFDIQTLDPELGRTLFELQALVRRKEFLEAMGQNQLEAVDSLLFRGSKLEDLCLDFTLPGYPDYELKTNGQDTSVCVIIVARVCLILTKVWEAWIY